VRTTDSRDELDMIREIAADPGLRGERR
jgi:hypothetical protein